MSERTTYLMKTWRDRALAAEAANDRVLTLADKWNEAAGTDRDNESRCLREVAAHLHAAVGSFKTHRPDCPALHAPNHPERCRCVFLQALDDLEEK